MKKSITKFDFTPIALVAAMVVLLSTMFITAVAQARTFENSGEQTSPISISCTADAKMCSDGSWVGRTGPSCEFVCPGDTVDSYTIEDIESVTSQYVDPIPMAVDDEYTEFVITLKNRVKHTVKSNHFAPAGLFEERVRETGYSGDIDELVDMAEEIESDEESSLKARPAKGDAPLTVEFTAENLKAGSEYIIEYGDGGNSGPLKASRSGEVDDEYDYERAGNYKATLQAYYSCMWASPNRCMMAAMPIDVIDIKVSSGSEVDDEDSDTVRSLRNQIATLQARLRELLGQNTDQNVGKRTKHTTPWCDMNWSRSLRVGDSGEDVRNLQRFLNQNNFAVATAGDGALGQETNYFGQRTALALSRFQEQHREDILAPAGISQGSGYFGDLSKRFVKKHCDKSYEETPGNSTGTVVPTNKVNYCSSGDMRLTEGTKVNSYENEDGTRTTIADAVFVCRDGEWKVQGSGFGHEIYEGFYHN